MKAGAGAHCGVISPYWVQVAPIRSLLWETEGLRGVEVRTVDGSQGWEKEYYCAAVLQCCSATMLKFYRTSGL